MKPKNKRRAEILAFVLTFGTLGALSVWNRGLLELRFWILGGLVAWILVAAVDWAFERARR